MGLLLQTRSNCSPQWSKHRYQPHKTSLPNLLAHATWHLVTKNCLQWIHACHHDLCYRKNCHQRHHPTPLNQIKPLQFFWSCFAHSLECCFQSITSFPTINSYSYYSNYPFFSQHTRPQLSRYPNPLKTYPSPLHRCRRYVISCQQMSLIVSKMAHKAISTTLNLYISSNKNSNKKHLVTYLKQKSKKWCIIILN
jgi:hypothetical protein